ncbi:MAG: CoA transferase subunit A [Dehalococcoidia bacterium]
MAINKVYPSFAAAVADVPDGASIMIGGFGGRGGMASYLIAALREQGAKDLTIIGNTLGLDRDYKLITPGEITTEPFILVENKQIKKAIASFPVPASPSIPSAFKLAYRRGEVELEIVPQGTLAERIRAGAAGIGGFYTPTGVGTVVAEGKEVRVINGREYLLEMPLRADYAFVRAYKADTMGNLTYIGTSRAFNPVVATAADVTIVEVNEIVEPGQIDSELIVTPGVYVHRIVQRPPEGRR